jgi:hypothetical protein
MASERSAPPPKHPLLSALDESEERVRALKAALRSKRLPPGSVPIVRHGEVERAFRELAAVEGTSGGSS